MFLGHEQGALWVVAVRLRQADLGVSVSVCATAGGHLGLSHVFLRTTLQGCYYSGPALLMGTLVPRGEMES